MKKLLNIIVIASMGIAMAACTPKETLPEQTPDQDGGFTYTLTIGGETRTVLDEDHFAWQTGDQIGWFTDKAGSSKINMSANPRSFNVSSTSALAAGSLIYAYAPYKSGSQAKESVPLSIPVSQNGATVKDAMPLVSLPIEISSAMPASTLTPAGEARFVNLGSVIRYNVYSSNSAYATEKLESIMLSASSAIAGDFKVDLTKVALDAVPAPSGLNQKVVTSSLSSSQKVGSDKTSAISVYQVVAPGSCSGTITVQTDKATYVYNVSNLQFPRNTMTPVTVDLASANAKRTAKGGDSSLEAKLAGKTWKISAFGEYYDEKYPVSNGASLYADDTITFNADHTITYSIKNGIFYWDNSDTAGYAFTPSGSEKWALEEKSDGTYLTLSGGGIPLMMVTEADAIDGSFKVLSLSDSMLSIFMVISGWDGYQTYLDFVPANGGGSSSDLSAEEAKLAGKAWKISAFGEYYGEKYPVSDGASLYADDTITFKADHTISYSIKNGIFYWDNSSTAGYGFTPSGSEKWALEEKSDGIYLTLSGGGIPLMMVTEADAINGSFKVLSLSDSMLSIYMVISGWDGYQTYLDFVPAPN